MSAARAALTPVAPPDVNALIKACADCRAAMSKAQRNRSERPDRVRAAKARLADAEFRRDAAQIEAEAGGDADATTFALLDAAVNTAKADVEALHRNTTAEAAIIETLRGRLTDARMALCKATEPQRNAVLKIAEARYASGIQQIRDAVTIIGKLQDEMLPSRMRIMDIEPGAFAFDRTTPSPDIVDTLLEIDPAVREIDTALRQIIR